MDGVEEGGVYFGYSCKGASACCWPQQCWTKGQSNHRIANSGSRVKHSTAHLEMHMNFSAHPFISGMILANRRI